MAYATPGIIMAFILAEKRSVETQRSATIPTIVDDINARITFEFDDSILNENSF